VRADPAVCRGDHPFGAVYYTAGGVCPQCGEETRGTEQQYLREQRDIQCMELLKLFSAQARLWGNNGHSGRRVRPRSSSDGPGHASTGDGDWGGSVRRHGFFGMTPAGDLRGGCW
jgi:hypothetical protein